MLSVRCIFFSRENGSRLFLFFFCTELGWLVADSLHAETAVDFGRCADVTLNRMFCDKTLTLSAWMCGNAVWFLLAWAPRVPCAETTTKKHRFGICAFLFACDERNQSVYITSQDSTVKDVLIKYDLCGWSRFWWVVSPYSFTSNDVRIRALAAWSVCLQVHKSNVRIISIPVFRDIEIYTSSCRFVVYVSNCQTGFYPFVSQFATFQGFSLQYGLQNERTHLLYGSPACNSSSTQSPTALEQRRLMVKRTQL